MFSNLAAADLLYVGKSSDVIFSVFYSGVGKTCPDPKGDYEMKDGSIIPMGKTSDATIASTSLLYNEYPFSIEWFKKWHIQLFFMV